jgi:alpha-glucosidase
MLLLACCALRTSAAGAAGLEGLEPIGPLQSFRTNTNGVTIACQDQSEVGIELLAPDLVRVRAAFRKALPAQEHSWAIAKTSWTAPRWKVAEQADRIVLSTDELDIVVHRSPLLIDFEDPRTHLAIDSDERPMMYDPKSTRVGAAKKLGFDEHFYGLGEKAAHLDKRRGRFTMWNSDTYAYKEGTDPIYQSIPFYIGWQHGEAYGIFFDNSYATHFDFGATTEEYASFAADGGELNYYFFQGPSIKKILQRYADLTGHMPMQPLWSLGHQQSRYSYYPDRLVEEVADRYRADDLPLDVIHLDIHYMNGYRDFTWDPKRFPNPKALADKLKQKGVKLVTIVDPGVKFQPPDAGARDAAEHPELAPQDASYYVYNQGKAGDYFLKRKDGRPYVGKVWPGDAVFVDYTIDAAVRWWGNLFHAYTDNGVAGIWTDMNEPSDFVDKSGQSQADVVSYDGGENSLYAKNRNVFALGMARATYQGLERIRPGERPFVITRAGYAGIQQYATMWTGDSPATWASLALSLPMFESLGLSGEPFAGADVGGFAGNTNAELLTRWYQVGFLTPLFRNHANRESNDHEPWRFGKYYEDIIRKYLKLRYRLLPFLYTTLEEAHRTGVPLFRPLLLNFQSDANTLTIDDEFMVGDDLLAAPVTEAGATSRLVYLPAGTWFDYWTGAPQAGERTIRVSAPLETIPLFVRGGAILPLGPEMNWVGEKPSDPISFRIYPDANGTAATSLYEDDGATPAYLRGAFRRTNVSYRNGEIDVSVQGGDYHPPAREFVFSVSSREIRVKDDGHDQRITIR